MKANNKIKLVKTDNFDLLQCGNAIAEDVIQMRGAETARANLNKHLGEAYAHGVQWGRASVEGSLAAILSDALKQRGLTDGSVRTTLCTLKFCFENKIKIEDLTLSRMKDSAKKGAVSDLITGEPKKIKVADGNSAKGKAPKAEKVVKHVGYHMLAACESEGFMKWLDHFIDALEIRGVDSTDIDDIKLSLVRDTLKECGFATQDEKGEYTVSLIKESDNEVDEDE